MPYPEGPRWWTLRANDAGAPSPVAGGSRAASRALGAVAGLVEHLPPFPRGERPSTHAPRTDVER